MDTDLLDKGYMPQDVEKRWYAYWESENLFAAREDTRNKGYAIVIPPPNVTGVLHMGHALNNTMQDILCRYRRLQGDNVLWMPGTDHAGIATQNVVERKLAAEGTDRHQLGREKFIEAVWQWRAEYGSAIINQLKRMGASCDWQRERFTMDEGLSRAVRKVFVQLYDDGLIYRGNYITNWCPRCHTALSDLEVEHEELAGHLYRIRYPYANGQGNVVVATTRPETMLGDTAVAVHPDDERYHDMPVDTVILPLMERPIPIIRDDYVDTAFGTGALKVTPAHDPNDFEIGGRHQLESIKVIGDDGCMTAAAGRFAGQDRFACRQQVVADLQAAGLLERIEDHPHGVGHCYRCKTVVEPNLSKQWFVRTQPLAKKAIEAVESGRTRIIPDAWNKTYFDWMYNIRDWCISRQIWWGHQIPAWTCSGCGSLVVAMTAPARCPDCEGADLIQETDVLDTWFSSALWPFSTMGWPDRTDLLKIFYPTAVLVTGFDILFFWVARMMMMGLHFMGDIPFKDVYVHALVRDENGQKMSKSKGNVIDPLKIIDQYGTDAFRFTLTAFAVQGRDVKMSEKRVEGYRHFINKLWNAARFSLMHVSSTDGPAPEELHLLNLPDRWILSRLTQVTDAVAQALDAYRFNEAAAVLYQFVWHELCDWYLEAIKPVLYGEDESARRRCAAVLGMVLKNTLVALHPIIPFVTEEIWHKLPGCDGSIMQAAYPKLAIAPDPIALAQMNLVIGIVSGVRNIRGETHIAPAKKLSLIVHAPDETDRAMLDSQRELLMSLARLDSVTIDAPGHKPAQVATAVMDGAVIFVPLAGVIDIDKEIQRLEKEIDKSDREMAAVSKKLSNDDYLQKAPEAVVAKTRRKYEQLGDKQRQLETNLQKIKAIKE